MKVKKRACVVKKTSRPKMKDCRVNLIRLDKSTIDRYLRVKPTQINYNLCLKIVNRNNEDHVSVIEESGTYVPLTITITSIHIQEKTDKYQLRARKPATKPETKPIKNVPNTKAVSVLGVNLKKKIFWANCKKAVNKSKLIENAFVFGKQVHIFQNHSDSIK